MPDTPQAPVDRFFKVADDVLKAAVLGQFGTPYTAAQIEKELQASATNLIPMWSPEDSPFVLTPPDVTIVQDLIAQAKAKYQAFLDRQ